MTINNDPKQSLWELWFVISTILCLSIFMIGTLPNSKETVPNWDICALLSFINIVICVAIGCKK